MLVSNFEIGSAPAGEGWDTRYQLQITWTRSRLARHLDACSCDPSP